MDNTFSRFSSKLVYFVMSTFIPDKWEKFAEELKKIDMSIQVFSVSNYVIFDVFVVIAAFKFLSFAFNINTNWYLYMG